MAGMLVIDTQASFTAVLVMGSAPKMAYGTDQQDVSSTGERKWQVDVAVTYTAEPGQRVQSDVLAVTVLGADPAVSIQPGTPVEFDRLRIGVSGVDKRDNGRVVGGKPFYMAAGVRPAHGQQQRKAEAA